MNSFDVIVVILGAVPATLATLIYFVAAPWWRSWPGRAFFSTMLALALLLDLTLFFRWWPNHWPVKQDIAHGVYVLVAIACWLKLYAVLREQFKRHRRRR